MVVIILISLGDILQIYSSTGGCYTPRKTAQSQAEKDCQQINIDVNNIGFKKVCWQMFFLGRN